MGGKNGEESCPTLKDFDWQLSLAMSSDKMAALGEPLVNLDMHLDNKGQMTNFSLEMDASELQLLIDTLEAAHKEILRTEH